MKETLYCLDRKEGSILVFENTDTLQLLEIGAEKFDVSLCEGDIVRIGFSRCGRVSYIQKDDVETRRRREENQEKLRRLFDK